MSKENTVCFTGKRPKDLCGYNEEAYKELVRGMITYLKNEFYDKGYRNFISGGAQGFDQLAFWAVNHMKRQYGLTDVSNIVYVPIEGQERLWGKDGVFSRAQYKAMLKAADKVEILENATDNRSLIVSALFNRNHRMVDASSAIIALYPDDEYMTKERSGTAECLRYAARMGVKIHRIGYEIKNNILIPDFSEAKDKEPER